MSATNMPGFTAEASLYKTDGHYRFVGAQSHSSVEQGFVPQIFRGGLGDTAGDLCVAACICCRLPSPVVPECCGACIACSIWTIFGAQQIRLM
ncbi:MAG TPA: hypothetical protein VGM07_06515 [Stellaceae bacterium]|jgi:hypothetical protein